MAQWRIENPQRIELDTPSADGVPAGLAALRVARVRVVAGHVNIVATTGPAALEVTAIEGPPLLVTRTGDELVITHEKLTWSGVLEWTRNLLGARISATVSLSVPEDCEVELALVSADAVVSGLQRRPAVRSVSGDIVLDGLADGVSAQTVSGDVQANGLSGRVRFETVSGDLTVVDGDVSELSAKTVSGSLTVDLSRADAELSMGSVSGSAVLRLPGEADLRVEASSTSGSLESEFAGLRRDLKPGRTTMSGIIGEGRGRCRIKTVSGDVTLLRRKDTGVAGQASA